MRFESFEKLPEERKEKILAAGIRAFSEKMYREASTDAITRECRISKGILFHYSLYFRVINSDVCQSEVSQEGTLVNKESKPHDCR